MATLSTPRPSQSLMEVAPVSEPLTAKDRIQLDRRKLIHQAVNGAKRGTGHRNHQ